jgi:hypothetical protein
VNGGAAHLQQWTISWPIDTVTGHYLPSFELTAINGGNGGDGAVALVNGSDGVCVAALGGNGGMGGNHMHCVRVQCPVETHRVERDLLIRIHVGLGGKGGKGNLERDDGIGICCRTAGWSWMGTDGTHNNSVHGWDGEMGGISGLFVTGAHMKPQSIACTENQVNIRKLHLRQSAAFFGPTRGSDMLPPDRRIYTRDPLSVHTETRALRYRPTSDGVEKFVVRSALPSPIDNCKHSYPGRGAAKLYDVHITATSARWSREASAAGGMVIVDAATGNAIKAVDLALGYPSPLTADVLKMAWREGEEEEEEDGDALKEDEYVSERDSDKHSLVLSTVRGGGGAWSSSPVQVYASPMERRPYGHGGSGGYVVCLNGGVEPCSAIAGQDGADGCVSIRLSAL